MIRAILILCSFWLCLQADYRRTLQDVEVEESSLHFLLDNGWVLTSELTSYDTHKLHSLDRLIGTSVYFETYPQKEQIILHLENKTSFPVWFQREDYLKLPTVTDVNTLNWLLGWTGSIALSDGSKWNILKSIRAEIADRYWSVGDRIIVSEKSIGVFTLVNLDVSGITSIGYYRKSGDHYFSLRDAKTVEVRKK